MHSMHISSGGAKCVHTTIQSSPFASSMLCPSSSSVNRSLRSCPYMNISSMLSVSVRRSLPALPQAAITRLQPMQTIRHTSHRATTNTHDNYHDKVMWLYQLPPRSAPIPATPFTAANPNPLFGITHALPTIHAAEVTSILPAVPAAAAAVTTAPLASVSASSDVALESEVDDELASASMSAFAKMEAQMRANKKKQQQQEAAAAAAANASAIGEPITLQVESLELVGTKAPLGMSNSWSIKFPLQKPLEPTAGMCCGRDCPNCVWIQYSNALSDYEDEQKQLGFPDVKFTQGPQVDAKLNAKRGILEDQEPHAPISDMDIPTPASDSVDRGVPLSPFERAMRRERDQLRSVIKPQGKRTLGSILLPKERDDKRQE